MTQERQPIHMVEIPTMTRAILIALDGTLADAVLVAPLPKKALDEAAAPSLVTETGEPLKPKVRVEDLTIDTFFRSAALPEALRKQVREFFGQKKRPGTVLMNGEAEYATEAGVPFVCGLSANKNMVELVRRIAAACQENGVSFEEFAGKMAAAGSGVADA